MKFVGLAHIISFFTDNFKLIAWKIPGLSIKVCMVDFFADRGMIKSTINKMIYFNKINSEIPK